MSFNQRTNLSDKLINILNNYYWNTDDIKNKYKMLHVPYGYENFFNLEIQEKMKHRYTDTTKFIRYSPDYFILQENSNNDCFLEYKVTKTPRFSFKEKQWDYGQIEADALENYFKLISIGIDVAIVIYCPYHKRPLLCGIPNNDWIIGDRQRTASSNGSGTDYYNIDLSKISSFPKFFNDFFNVPIAITQQLLNQDFFDTLKNDNQLKTEHASRSYYNNKNYKTGFNWLIDESYYQN